MNALPQMQAAMSSHEAMEQAAEWFSLLRSGTASEVDKVRWQEWLNASEDRRVAWDYVERVSRRFEPLRTEASSRIAATALQTASHRLSRRGVILGAVATVGLGGLLGWNIWRQPHFFTDLLAGPADYKNATGQIREIVLSDGTHVWLGSDSGFDLNFDASLRRLHLLSGEILIQTAGDAVRPFVVDTIHGRMRALGTRFNVRLDDRNSTQLSVFEGAVRVNPADTTGSTTIGAGQQLRFTANHLEPVVAADSAREAWSRGVLLARDIPLGEVIAELSRYRHGHLGVSPEVALLPVLGSYPLDDVDGALSMLQKALPIRVRQVLPWWTTVEARTR